VVGAGVHRVSSIRVAEAAKVIENTQRDLNIAFVNELAIIFDKLGLDTAEVLNAAGTKWNFLQFRPGLVGGHCIGVDPYYLTHKAELAGYHPEVILAGRRINDGMGQHIARKTVQEMIHAGRNIKGARVNVLGLTFKENCPDIRNSKVVDIVHELRQFGVETFVHDPAGVGGHAGGRCPDPGRRPSPISRSARVTLPAEDCAPRLPRRRQVGVRSGALPQGRAAGVAALAPA
jgi:UDP-N-acetyl-D-galactosamine dehydrogenase